MHGTMNIKIYALIGIGHPIPKGVGAISVGIATSYGLDGPGI